MVDDYLLELSPHLSNIAHQLVVVAVSAEAFDFDDFAVDVQNLDFSSFTHQADLATAVEDSSAECAGDLVGDEDYTVLLIRG